MHEPVKAFVVKVCVHEECRFWTIQLIGHVISTRVRDHAHNAIGPLLNNIFQYVFK
jgi:hypothetical protein